MRLPSVVVPVASLVGLALLGCHASTPPKTPSAQPQAPPQPSGRDYLLESSQGAELLRGTAVHLRFGGGQLAIAAACNDLSGEYSLEGDRVVVQGFMQTEMGCDAPRHAQDAWLAAFFRAKPRITSDAQHVTFTSDAAQLVFVDRELADPDRPLQTTVWSIDDYIDGETAMGLMGIEAPQLTFAPDGTWQARATCLEASGRYVLEGRTLKLEGTRATTTSPCEDSNDREAADFTRSVLADGELTFRIDAASLTLGRGARSLGAHAPQPPDGGRLVGD